MRILALSLAAFATLALAGCGDATDQQVTGAHDRSPEVDADPTPQTGTGGELPTATPEGDPADSPVQPAR